MLQISTITNSVIMSLGQNALVRGLIRWVNKNLVFKNPVCIKISGHKMYAQTFDRILALLMWKFFGLEEFEAEVVKKYIKQDDVVYDIGANIGFYTLILARLVGSKGKVYAFEPDPLNFSLLVKNISENNYSNIEAINCAVSNIDGEINFYQSEEHRGDHRIYDPGDGRQTIKVKTITIDNFFKANRSPRFIKIDIQGAEYMALSGMKNLLNSAPDLDIIIEYWPIAIKGCGYSPERLLTDIENLGFLFYYIDEKNKSLNKMTKDLILSSFHEKSCINLLLTRAK